MREFRVQGPGFMSPLNLFWGTINFTLACLHTFKKDTELNSPYSLHKNGIKLCSLIFTYVECVN